MKKVLVTGATGNAGSRVVGKLRDLGVPVRAFVRDAGRAAAVLGDGVEVAVGDFANAASVRRALDGVEGVFLACANVPSQVEHETTVINAVAGAGVRRIVKLSALGAEVGSPVAFWDWHGRIEDHLRASGVPAVVLRPTFFTTNLLGAAEQVRHEGALFAPTEGARISMIDPEDVAAVAAAVLAGAGRTGETHVLTGPEAITYGRVAEDLSAVLGRNIRFVPVPDGAVRESLVGAGMPEFVAGQLVGMFGALRAGAHDTTTDAVRMLRGRKPRGFAAFARDHAEAFGA